MTRATWDISGLDLSDLRAHVREMHAASIEHLARSNADLAAEHAKLHTRSHAGGHNHLVGRVTIRAGSLRLDYDEGWITGRGAITPEQAAARIFGMQGGPRGDDWPAAGPIANWGEKRG
jgi:hypothetical protein